MMERILGPIPYRMAKRTKFDFNVFFLFNLTMRTNNDLIGKQNTFTEADWTGTRKAQQDVMFGKIVNQ
jgi:hypothetical protein